MPVKTAVANEIAKLIKCKWCGAPIFWARIFETRGWTALDSEPSPRGQAILLRDGEGAMLVDPEVNYTAEVHARRHHLHRTTCSGWPTLRSATAGVENVLSDDEQMLTNYWDARRERIRWAKLQEDKHRDLGFYQ